MNLFLILIFFISIICNTFLFVLVIPSFRKEVSIIRAGVFGIVAYFFISIITSVILFSFDVFSIGKNAIITFALIAIGTGISFIKFKTKPLKALKFNKKECIFFVAIVLVVLLLSGEKFGFFGMGQDQGVYQTKAIELIYGNNTNELDIYYPQKTLNEEDFEYYRDEMGKLQGYYLIGQVNPAIPDFENGGENRLKGVYHGISTWPAILALFGEMFGVDHMQDCQTIFFICFLMLVFYILENLKVKTIVEATSLAILATTSEMVWVSKSALTEMFLAVIIATFIYLICHEKKNVRLFSWVPVAVFSFFHVSIYTMMPLFVVVGWMIMAADKRKRAILPAILMLVSFLLGFVFMMKQAILYTSFNYIVPLRTYIPNLTNKRLMFLAVGTVLIVLGITVILFAVVRGKHTKKAFTFVNKKAGLIIKICSALLLLFVTYKYIKGNGGIRFNPSFNVLAMSLATGILTTLLIFIGIFVVKKDKIKGFSYFAMYFCFFYIMIWSVLLRGYINHFYYFGRYDAPYFSILVIMLALVYRDIRKADWIPAVCTVSVIIYIKYDSVILKNPDDTKIGWNVVKNELNQNHGTKSAMIIDNDYDTMHEWFHILKASGVEAYPKMEDFDSQIEKLSLYYDEIYYLYEGAFSADLSSSVYDFELLRKSPYVQSEDLVNEVVTWIGYPKELFILEKVNEVYKISGRKEAYQSEYYEFDLLNDSLFEGKCSDEEMGDYCITLSAKTDNFSGLSVGKNYDTGTYLQISDDKIYIFKDQNEIYQTDLNIKIRDNIRIKIECGLQDKATIEITGNDSYQLISDVPWSARIGKIFVKTDESTLMRDCVLSYDCYGWDKPVWVMGDSYLNCTSPARWTSYLTLNGYDEFLLNGYAGRNSDAALDSLKTMLKYDTPDEIIWCMGMNDGDEEGINENWLADVEELENICEAKGITLILSTIPNCPSVNNNYKNQYVKESGYKYIDFAQAVGAADDSDWEEGLLEEAENPVHPTELGAKALYNEAVSVCPELLYAE